MANTEQRPARRGGFSLFRAMRENSSMLSRKRWDCWSRNDPVPAAHMVFMAKSSMTRPPPSAGETRIILASSPPMSMMVRAWGQKTATPRARATISFTTAPSRSGARLKAPVPVSAKPENSSRGYRANISSSTPSATLRGLPLVRV